MVGKMIYAVGEIHCSGRPLKYVHVKRALAERGVRRIFAELREDQEEEFKKNVSLDSYEADLLRLDVVYSDPKHLNDFSNWLTKTARYLEPNVNLGITGEQASKMSSDSILREVQEEASELMKRNQEIQLVREKEWVARVHDNYVEPSLIFCAIGHLEVISPVNVSRMLIESLGTGKVPEMLESLGYSVKRLFLESES